MATQTLNDFNSLDFEALYIVEGGRNNWQANVSGAVGSATSGGSIGATICAASGVGMPLVGVCAYTGAKLGFAIWAGVTGATGGF